MSSVGRRILVRYVDGDEPCFCFHSLSFCFLHAIVNGSWIMGTRSIFISVVTSFPATEDTNLIKCMRTLSYLSSWITLKNEKEGCNTTKVNLQQTSMTATPRESVLLVLFPFHWLRDDTRRVLEKPHRLNVSFNKNEVKRLTQYTTGTFSTDRCKGALTVNWMIMDT